MRESSQRSANLRLHLGPRKNEGIAEDVTGPPALRCVWRSCGDRLVTLALRSGAYGRGIVVGRLVTNKWLSRHWLKTSSKGFVDPR